MIARVVLSEGDQPNALVPNFDNARKLARKELESECACANSCYSQFPEDEIQLQMTELGNQKMICTHVHIQHETSVKLLFLKIVFCT